MPSWAPEGGTGGADHRRPRLFLMT